jgi:hypothetical protein
MPVRDFVEGNCVRGSRNTDPGIPDWMPGHMPAPDTLKYLQLLFGVGFVVTGLLYFAGVTNVKSITQQHVADVVHG